MSSAVQGSRNVDGAGANQGALLLLSNVSKSFGGIHAVQKVSIAVQPGSISGLIGPNGAGKTTIFNLITGVLPPTSGDIAFDGVSIKGMPSHRIIRRGMARTFQNIRLFRSMTVSGHVRIGQSLHAESGPRSLIPFGLDEGPLTAEGEEILKLLGLWEDRKRPATQLSYGGQRRVEIARALATRPRLLLLDEPAAGMNHSESEELLGDLRAIRNRGITILLIEHDMDVVMTACDYVYVLNFGEKIAEGTPKAIQVDPLVLEAYLGRD